eukprot:12804522-Alexandrium_andersonii.AAC.1
MNARPKEELTDGDTTNWEFLQQHTEGSGWRLVREGFLKPEHQMVTYRAPGVNCAPEVCLEGFAELDYFVVPSRWRNSV